MPATKDRYDVVIVGYGPTGAIAANLLGRDGFSVLVVEREADIYDKPRAITFDHEIMRVFQGAGVAEAVEKETAPYRPSRYLGAEGQVIRKMDPAPAPYPLYWLPVYLFVQPRLEAALRAGAEARETVDVLTCHEATNVSQTAEVATVTINDLDGGDSFEIEAAYVFACDGASSPIRTALGIGHEDLAFDERWIVIDVLANDTDDLPQTHIQFCEPERPSTYVIGVDNHRRWEMMLLPGEDPAEINNEERILELLSRWGPKEKFNVWRSAVYRFHALVAKEWRKGRVFLLGDAAHQTPPFMGQGMCQGIRDAENLVWRVRQVERHGADPALLDSYQAERHPHVRALTAFTKELGKIICERDPKKAKARDEKMVEQLESGRMVTMRHKLIPPLTSGLLDLDADGVAAAPAGELFPQPMVRTETAEELPMNDALRPDFWLVSPDPDVFRQIPDNIAEQWRSFGGEFVLMAGETENIPGIRRLTELNGVLSTYFEDNNARTMIVRPDRYTYSAAATAEQALTQMENLLSRLGPAETAKP